MFSQLGVKKYSKDSFKNIGSSWVFSGCVKWEDDMIKEFRRTHQNGIIMPEGNNRERKYALLN